MQQAQLYQIIGSNGQRYIGCTTRKYLSQRMAEHRYAATQKDNGNSKIFCCSSRVVLRDPAARMELIERFAYEDINELKKRENWYISNLKDVINVRKNVIIC